ncbi:MAG: DUF5618 family protein [Nitrospirae bacterium]|nr:DUF5618 family protein [Nitrospirota bacterium]
MGSKIQDANGFDDAIRYYRNAEELLARCKTEGKRYEDIKPVREAFGTAWLAVDMATKTALIRKGLPEQRIPESWDGLLQAVGQRLAVHNGKLVRLLSDARKLIHIAGYYHGEIFLAPVAREAMELARLAIEKLSHRKIG